jgi:hypothetical protein
LPDGGVLFVQTGWRTAPRPGNLYLWRRQIGGAVGPTTTVRCLRSSVRSHHVIIATWRDGWTHRVIS